jgi:peptidyl-prolyl cis-trans isomerase A (cyclophilin A)
MAKMSNKLPVVLIQTGLGDIAVEIDTVNAPVTAQNFLRYIAEGYFKDAHFYRTVKPDNQPDNAIKIEVIQGGVKPPNPERDYSAKYPAIPLEPTTTTGLRHLDGTISMARFTPDSATTEFFICINDQPELDFGGKRNPDGQGFAAFGKVVSGMEVVRQIQLLPAEGQAITPPLKIAVKVQRLEVG